MSVHSGGFSGKEVRYVKTKWKWRESGFLSGMVVFHR